jgi:dipeptidase
MCDTLIATQLATADGVAVFGKNSDRPPNEGQHLAYFPAQTHPAGGKVKCTYIEIPQVERTHAVLLSKPYWMWGAEIGVNEHGLVIGNEAIFSKIPANKESALLGMDLLRAALERAVTAREGLQVILDLLETFGQGGNCDSDGDTLYYHNSFIIADANNAWVLETVDKQWAARQIKDTYSISNCLTLNNEFDLSSPGLVELAVQKGFAKSTADFNYAKDYSDFLFTTFGRGRGRRATTVCALNDQKGKVDVASMMNILRRHDSGEPNPQNGIANVDVCMHAGFGPIRVSQSTASLVAYLDGNAPLIFATGTSAPCTGIFKPMWMDAALPDLGAIPTAQYDPASLYWTHERLHRATLLNYPERIKTYADDRDALEKKFLQGALKLKGASAKERGDFTAACFREAAQASAEWLKRVEKIPARKKFFHSLGWNGFNKKAKMPVIS